jgi:broad specificity phosphatase PhoE
MMFLLALGATTFQPAEIVFVRHSETVANATGRYNSATLNAFSKRGIAQTGKLTATLQKSEFDQILVSPSPRALKTIAPLLQRTDQRAEVWPELLEVCHQKGSERLKPPSPQIRFGDRIEWPTAFESIFMHREGGERYILAPTYADGKRQIQMTQQMLNSRFSGSGRRILVVGHSIHGGKLIALLTGTTEPRVENAKPIRLIESRPGRFAIKF